MRWCRDTWAFRASLEPRWSRLGGAAIALGVACAAACGGTEPARPSAASGGMGGMAGGSGGGAKSSGGASASGGTTRGGRSSREPAGENALTLLHGIVDAPEVFLCFATGSGAERRYPGSPAPAGGLKYGASWVVPQSWLADVASELLQPVVIAGELELLDGLDCEAAVALALEEQGRAPMLGEGGGAGQASSGGTGQLPPSAGGVSGGGTGGAGGNDVPEGGAGGAPRAASAELTIEGGQAGAGGQGGSGLPLPPPPRLRVAELPAVPGLEADAGQSQLLVATGCIGGPAYAGEWAESACGEGYAPLHPTLSGVWVTLSRATSTLRLGLQVLHASQANGLVQIWFQPEDASMASVRAAGDLSYGTILPRPASTSFSAKEYGVGDASYRIQVYQNASLLLDESWETVLDRAAAPAPEDGKNYTLVLIGPELGLNRRGFWNPPALSWVLNSPE